MEAEFFFLFQIFTVFMHCKRANHAKDIHSKSCLILPRRRYKCLLRMCIKSQRVNFLSTSCHALYLRYRQSPAFRPLTRWL